MSFYFECLNPACRLRFPAGETEHDIHCPGCRSDVIISSERKYNLVIPKSGEETPFHSCMALLDNVRSGENVGSILRTCDAAAIQRVMVCGITPQPKDATVRKTALGAENSIAVSNFRNSRDALEILKKIGADLVILEGGSADNVFDYCLPEIPVCFVVGNEVHGVDPLLYDAAKQVIHLPMVGRKESLNVAAAFSAAIYAIWCGSLVRKRERK